MEITVEWYETDEPHRVLARVEVRDDERVVVVIENITREQIEVIAHDFAATESDMRWHEARNGHDRCSLCWRKYEARS